MSSIPYVGGSVALVAQRTIEGSRQNAAEAGAAAVEEAGDPKLSLQRMAEDERLAYMLSNAAARSSPVAKRRLLGRVVGRAVKDPVRG